MLLVAPVQKKHWLDGGVELKGLDRLKTRRSSIPAVTHVDYSARVQTVDLDRNSIFYQLIARFYEKTGCPVIVNTSFNVRGEPIVCSPSDAYRCFMRTEMDALVIGNFLLEKEKQDPSKLRYEEVNQFALD